MSGGAKSLEDLIGRYEDAEARLDAKIRDANSATKALRQAERDARAALASMTTEVQALLESEVRPAIDVLLTKLVEEMTETVGAAREEAVERVMASFEELRQTLMGEAPDQRKAHPDRPSIPEIIHARQVLERAQASDFGS